MTRHTKITPLCVTVGQGDPDAAKRAAERHKILYALLENFRVRFEHGEHEFLERALAAAIKHSAPLPQWLADALLKVVRESEGGRAAQRRKTREKDRMRSIVVAILRESEGMTKEKAIKVAAQTTRGFFAGGEEAMKRATRLHPVGEVIIHRPGATRTARLKRSRGAKNQG